MTRRILPAAVALACAAAPGAASADVQDVALPATGIPLSQTPPLLAGSQRFQPVFRGRIPSREQVLVDVDATGAPSRVRAVQRLRVDLGDYFFGVPAPVTDVSAAPGSATQPGLREGAIVWQGFSPGHRLLASNALLRLKPSAAALPLALAMHATVGGQPLRAGERRSGPLDLTVTLQNRTRIGSRTFTARTSPEDVAGLLDRLRDVHGPVAPFIRVHTPVRNVSVRVEAPLKVEGTIVVPGRPPVRIPVSRLLGDGRPLTVTLHQRRPIVDAGPPMVDLTVQPVAPENALTPPGGGTWTDAVRAGRAPRARKMLAIAAGSLLRLARVRQYDTYLANPDVAGTSRTSYRYVSGRTPSAAPAPEPAANDGTSPYAILGAALAGVLALGGLAALWARS